MPDLKISQLPVAETLSGSEVTDGVQSGANVQIPLNLISQMILRNPVTTGTSVQLGENSFFTLMSAGDVWFTCNASFDGTHWQRVNPSNYSFAVVLSPFTNIPGEDDNTGMLFLRCVPDVNPINDTFGTTGGWETGFIMDQFRHLIVGGFGLEADGSGTTPYGRFIHYSNGNVAPKYTGIASNIFVDLSGTDDNGEPSWFIGRIDDGAYIKRAQAGSTTLSQLWSVGNTGMITENAATYVGTGSPPGTPLLAAVNIVTSGSNVTLATADNPGQKQVVINTSGSGIQVWPPDGGTVESFANIIVGAHTQRTFYAATSIDWY